MRLPAKLEAPQTTRYFTVSSWNNTSRAVYNPQPHATAEEAEAAGCSSEARYADQKFVGVFSVGPDGGAPNPARFQQELDAL